MRNGLDASTLASKVYESVRQGILSGDLQPGQPMSRRRIATELRTSPLPVASAFQRLEIEGLLESRPRAGTRVRALSLDEIRGLLQLSRGGVAPCDRVIALAGAHLEQIEERIRQFQMFRDRLASALTRWRSGDCGSSSRGLCNLLDVSPPRFEASASLAPENVGFNRRMRATASPRRRP